MIAIDLGVAIVHPKVAEFVTGAAEALISDAGLERVDVAVNLPPALFEWAMSNLVTLRADLADRYPACEGQLTMEIMFGMNIGHHHYDLAMAGTAESFRVRVNETMADIFEQTDFVLSATNPDLAFAAEGPMPMKVGDVDLVATYGFVRARQQGCPHLPRQPRRQAGGVHPGRLVDDIPVGMQVIGRHHEEELLLDLALAVAERNRPWPLVAPAPPAEPPLWPRATPTRPAAAGRRTRCGAAAAPAAGRVDEHGVPGGTRRSASAGRGDARRRVGDAVLPLRRRSWPAERSSSSPIIWLAWSRVGGSEIPERKTFARWLLTTLPPFGP